MRRRDFVGLLAGMSIWPLAAHAQQRDKVKVIGVLMGFAENDPNAQGLVAALRTGLAGLGWVEGGNLRIELRWAAGDPEKIKTYTKELVALRPDALLGQITPVLRALASETSDIPIVFAVVSDPIGGGWATSVTRPGGNVTGFTDAEPAMGGKWVQILKELAPSTQSAALLFNPATAPPVKFYLPSIHSAASQLGVDVIETPVRARDQFGHVIAAQAARSDAGLIVMPDGFNTTHRDLIIELTAHRRLPAVYFNRYFAQSGGLIGYGVEYTELFRKAAGYIDRILRGDKPGELPIQLPSKFELVINTKTAKALSIAIPNSLLAQADEVIE
jgi:putative tryptophan/tyrosine transport system substrate-binding protein